MVCVPTIPPKLTPVTKFPINHTIGYAQITQFKLL